MTAQVLHSNDDWLRFVVVDVFTAEPFTGNPLAVVLGAEGLTTEQLQGIAREFNLSETAFPLPADESNEVGSGTAEADYRLRIFTPVIEVPFAGHPSIGAAWFLAQSGLIPTGEVRQLCGEGILPITVTPTGATLTGGAPRVSDPIDPGPALAAVGLTSSDLAGPSPRIASTGLAYAVLVVSPEALARCEPDLGALSQHFSYPNEATGVYVVAWDGQRRAGAARMFAGDIGSPEDPATGSAALAFGAYLPRAGLLPDGIHRLTLEQGKEMGRHSTLSVECHVESGVASRVTVTGQAVLVSEGRINPGRINPGRINPGRINPGDGACG